MPANCLQVTTHLRLALLLGLALSQIGCAVAPAHPSRQLAPGEDILGDIARVFQEVVIGVDYQEVVESDGGIPRKAGPEPPLELPPANLGPPPTSRPAGVLNAEMLPPLESLSSTAAGAEYFPNPVAGCDQNCDRSMDSPEACCPPTRYSVAPPKAAPLPPPPPPARFFPVPVRPVFEPQPYAPTY